ncbi:MAG: Protein of unknown function (DUF3007) [Candidatus Atelocyanobacterium thalassa isolate SIO64986]|uniref:DUF3007 family protein n=1 Tax=Candidatus Atelocyanobacterium thalassa isolate SIO64986 TaxID=1527444 RepID=A0A086CHD9_9CHRO|nr:MAG: Protein of unknown function (DUF3007) [Candidatus Atelocyanobacterium thalassa isolate SIO64986]
MKRIDVIIISLCIFAGGGFIYIAFRLIGLDHLSAGLWSQVLFILGLLGWTSTYLFRVANKNMTYNQQLKNYEDAVLQKYIEEMTPEELKELEREI